MHMLHFRFEMQIIDTYVQVSQTLRVPLHLRFSSMKLLTSQSNRLQLLLALEDSTPGLVVARGNALLRAIRLDPWTTPLNPPIA